MSNSDEKRKAAGFLSRRQFVCVAGAGVTATAFASAKTWTAGTALRMGGSEDLVFQSATRLAELIRTKEVSSEEVVKAFLGQIQKVNPKLNAVVEITAQSALREAREADSLLARGQLKGPLHGVPMTIKDSINTAGVVTTHATLGCKGQVPKSDGTVVSRMKQAGAILLGKTNLPELALAAETDHLVYGRTNDPYRLHRNPGGSSGG
ncbi:MAG: amidase, partial [Acidobacteria bacterium]